MVQPEWVPEEIDIERASAARIYDYLLGGSHNFAADREFARKGMAIMPDMVIQAQANRAFLNRAVNFLVGAGVRQYLDIGSGIPTRGNVHEIAQRASADARVVYVDIDPVAVSHGRQILAGNDRATVIQEDFRHADAIVNHPDVRRLFDFEQPVALLMVALLHVIPDSDDPHGIVARLRDTFASGSYLVISHGTDEARPEEVHRLADLSKQLTTSLHLRTRREVERFFDGWELVEPGITWGPMWHPDSPDDVPDRPEHSGTYVGVGRKP